MPCPPSLGPSVMLGLLHPFHEFAHKAQRWAGSWRPQSCPAVHAVPPLQPPQLLLFSQPGPVVGSPRHRVHLALPR